MSNIRYAVISDGTVVNVIIGPEDFELDGFTLVASDAAGIGQLYSDGVFSDGPPAPEPVPSTISDRQFFHALWREGHITFEEALAAVKTGELPEDLELFVAALPTEQQQEARIFLEGATTFERNHPLTPFIASGMGWSDGQTDQIWRVGAAL